MPCAKDNQVVVIDNGSGFTKVGFAGNAEPQDIFQTAIGRRIRSSSSREAPLDDLNFLIDDSCNSSSSSSSSDNDTSCNHPLSLSSSTHNLNFPIKHGIIEDWDSMEKLWQMCIYNKLRCIPEDHYFLLTEPPLNKPENREQMAEILFETFNIPGLHIAIQAVLSLAASWTNDKVKTRDLTGLVVDSGYGSTHIVPVVDGHVISSCIEQMNIGGQDVTSYVQELLRERKEPIPYGMGMEVARVAKEQYSFTVPSIEKELERYDSNPEKYIKKYEGIHKKTGQKWNCNIGYERFLAPEIVLNPSIYDPYIKRTLPEMIDDVIAHCPIDTRRKLYSNIILSGGNTVFRDFSRRLQRDVKKTVETRLKATRATASTASSHSQLDSSDFNVNVIENNALNSSVWLGGSILASTDEFFDVCCTKSQYEEEGSRIFRKNVAFKASL